MRLSACVALAALTACGAAAHGVKELQPPRVTVRILWPDGYGYPYAVAFHYQEDCNTLIYDRHALSMVGEFMIEWPSGCKSTTMDLLLDITVNFMRCGVTESVRRSIRRPVVSGEVIAVVLDDSPECKRT